MSTPLTVVARLDSPVVEAGRRPLMLDSMLAWARALDGDIPPLTPEYAPDVPLPLATWDEDGQWGWRCSQGAYASQGWTTAQTRRKPATDAMARYARDRKHHLGLGPHKARDTAYEATWIHQITWSLDVTDRAELDRLLARITGIGKLAAHGYGHVTSWDITPGTPGAWRDRPMPSTHPGQRTRPPYWHPTGRF